MATIIETTAASLNRHAIAYNPTLHQKLRTGLEYTQDLTVRGCDHTWSAPNVDVGEVIQAYQSAFTPKNDETFDAEELTLQQQKIDITWKADDLAKFYESWRVDWYEVGKNPEEWSYTRYLYEMHIMPKLIEEENYNSMNGVYVAPTVGVPGVSINAVTGLIERFKTGVADGKIVEIPTGAITAANAVDRVEAFCDGIPEKYRHLPGKILASPTVKLQYYRDYRERFGTGNGILGNENSGTFVDSTAKQVVARHNLSGSQGLIFVPANRQNLVWGTRSGFNTMPVIRWNFSDIRVVKGTAEWYRFFGYEYAHEVFINDQFTV